MCRQSTYYHKMRLLLFKALGKKCVDCGRVDSLTFDVVIPDPEPKSHHGKMSSSARASYYVNQFLADNLAVRCDSCNSKKMHRDQANQSEPTYA